MKFPHCQVPIYSDGLVYQLQILESKLVSTCLSSFSDQQVGGHTTLEREVSPPPREANSASQSHSPTLSSSPASTEGHRENGVSRKRKSEVVPEWVKVSDGFYVHVVPI